MLSNSLFCTDKFGFMRNMSVEDKLLITYNDITKKVVWSGIYCWYILFDFQKACNVVLHRLLIDKLILIDVNGKLLEWIIDFLYARQSRRLMRAYYVIGNVCLWNHRIDERLTLINYLGHQNFKSVEKKNSVRLSVCPFVCLSVAIMGIP